MTTLQKSLLGGVLILLGFALCGAAIVNFTVRGGWWALGLVTGPILCLSGLFAALVPIPKHERAHH